MKPAFKLLEDMVAASVRGGEDAWGTALNGVLGGKKAARKTIPPEQNDPPALCLKRFLLNNDVFPKEGQWKANGSAAEKRTRQEALGYIAEAARKIRGADELVTGVSLVSNAEKRIALIAECERNLDPKAVPEAGAFACMAAAFGGGGEG